jgi:hypothetical protein
MGLPRFSQLLAAAIFAMMAAGACARSVPVAPFGAALEAARAAKDEMLRTSPDSPVPVDKRAQILPLAYFAPDETYVAAASLSPIDRNEQQTVAMPTSTGATRPMRRVGTLKFVLKGQPLKLTAFVEADEPDTDRLFVPFTDLTTGSETYHAGRYLELERTPTGIYEVDFNRAFNPYCYYNPTYDCPYPPGENRLAIPVRAGERTKTK